MRGGPVFDGSEPKDTGVLLSCPVRQQNPRVFDQPSSGMIRRALSENWAGGTWSSRLWKQSEEIGREMQKAALDLATAGKVSAETQESLLKQLREEENRSEEKELYLMHRATRTEAAHIANLAQADAYEEAGIEKYEYISRLEARTCDACGELDGKIFPLKDAREGVNYPVMHPWCRCTTAPVIPGRGKDGKLRWARDPETGEEMKVPAGMTFQEWKKGLKSAEKESMMKQERYAAIPEKYDGDFSDFEQLTISNEEAEYLSGLHKLAEDTGYEHGRVMADGVVSDVFTSNKADRVQIPEALMKKEHLQLYHSHTNATALSATDFSLLARENVDKISVETINGDVYSVRIGNGYRPSMEEFSQVERQIRQEVDTALIDDPDFLEWSVSERSYMAVREEAYRLARHFGWTLEGGRTDVLQ